MTPEPSETIAEEIGLTISTDDGEATGDFTNVDFERYEIEGEGAAQEAIIISNDGTAEVNALPALMSQEAFYQNFEGVFAIAGHATGNDGFPIKSHEKAGARATSDLIYEQCAKVSWLRWLVAEEGSDAARYLSVAMFGFGKYQAVKAGFIKQAEDRQKKAEAAANDN